MTFSFAAAALIAGRVDAALGALRAAVDVDRLDLPHPRHRDGLVLGLLHAGLGAASGSGTRFENASLMPWLAGTALLHSAVVMEKREALKVWTIFLAILAFSLSLVGTFLVRSGRVDLGARLRDRPEARLLHPRHSLRLHRRFAGAVRLARRQPPAGRPVRASVARRGALVLNNLLITAGCATVLVGTLYPLALESFTGQKISVGAPFFNATFVPLTIPVFLAMPIGSSLAWKRGDLLGAAQRMMVAILAGFVAILALALYEGAPAKSYCFAGLGIFVVVGSMLDLFRRISGGRPCECTGARARPAALGLRHGDRACRPRPDAARSRCRRLGPGRTSSP